MKAGHDRSKLLWNNTEDQEEEAMAAAKEISADAAVAPVLS